eukprot:CAMPEP_0116046844 /NCGR_PEP_ID=MMETSP0321-20121206/28512_1 /TAXON_ID=163516 /ORGANISM="Leptocylindrus danicus var. danicus, Strain B650" /LENGTH=557 /DNA_ID=CAMNT_0003528559 /DNA_START=269 /DNA_END=1942 /DNA_ORIENTATION=+
MADLVWSSDEDSRSTASSTASSYFSCESDYSLAAPPTSIYRYGAPSYNQEHALCRPTVALPHVAGYSEQFVSSVPPTVLKCTFIPSSVAQSDHPENPKDVESKKRKELRYKTELCKNYTSSVGCKFGDACHYAHGNDDLRRNTLLDLMDANMIDIDRHRVRPCFDWCSTGACPYGNRKGPNESWLPIMDKAEFKSKVHSHLYVEQFHHERINDVHNSGHSFRESIERIVHQLNIWEANQHPPYYPSIVSAKNKIEIAIEMRKSGQRGYPYKTHKLLGDLPCQILQARDFYIDPTSDELYLEDDGNGLGHHYLQKITAHEIVFGPSGEDNKHNKAIGVPTRALWFNVPASALTDTLPKSKRQAHGKPDPYQPVLRPLELNTFLHDDTYNLESEVLQFTLDQLKWHGYIRDKIGYYEIMSKIDLLQAFVQRWSWPVSTDRVAHLTTDTMEPDIDSLYQIDGDGSENSVLVKIWSSFAQVLSHDEVGGNISRLYSNYITPSRSGDDIVPYLSSEALLDHDMDAMRISRSERCWRSLLLPNTDSKGCNDWDLIRDEVGIVY